MANQIIFFTLLFLVCGYALWRGGAPERVVAAAFVATSVLTVIAARSIDVRFRTIEIGILLVDIGLFLVLLGVALRANRFWPIPVAALQLIAVSSHLAMPVYKEVLPWAYQVVIAMLSYPMLAILVIGAYRHRRRMRRFGVDRSWTHSSDMPGPIEQSFGRSS